MVHRMLLAAILAALVGSIGLVPNQAAAAPPRATYAVTVFATSPDWLNTGIFLVPGDAIRITSDSTDTWCWGDPFFGETCPNANGAVDRPSEEEQPTTMFPDGKFGQIYARIGNQIIPGSVDFTATVADSGSLELIMNERFFTHSDNSGSITFEVTISPARGKSAAHRPPPMSANQITTLIEDLEMFIDDVLSDPVLVGIADSLLHVVTILANTPGPALIFFVPCVSTSPDLASQLPTCQEYFNQHGRPPVIT